MASRSCEDLRMLGILAYVTGVVEAQVSTMLAWNVQVLPSAVSRGWRGARVAATAVTPMARSVSSLSTIVGVLVAAIGIWMECVE